MIGAAVVSSEVVVSGTSVLGANAVVTFFGGDRLVL